MTTGTYLYTWTVDTHSEPNSVVDGRRPSSEACVAGTDSALDRRLLACVGDDTGRSIENTLQLVGRLLWRTDQLPRHV